MNIIARITLAALDVALGTLLFVGGGEVLLGIHSGYALIDRLIGASSLLIGCLLWVSAYGIFTRVKWQHRLRWFLYAVIMLALSYVVVRVEFTKTENMGSIPLFGSIWLVLGLSLCLYWWTLRFHDSEQ